MDDASTQKLARSSNGAPVRDSKIEHMMRILSNMVSPRLMTNALLMVTTIKLQFFSRWMLHVMVIVGPVIPNTPLRT